MIAGGADPARVLPVAALPVLGEGVLADSLGMSTLRGTLAPQFPVECDGHSVLLDDVTGYGAVLFSLDDVEESFEHSGVHACTVGPGNNAWARWFESHDIRAVLIRPDHYVFGAVTDLADIKELVTRYRDLVGARTTHSPGEPISCV
jgi:hypothetical protein